MNYGTITTTIQVQGGFAPEVRAVGRKEGLRDETPLPLVLMIRKEAGKLVFEQTEYTARYLS